MVVLRKLGVWSVAKLEAIVFAIIGLIIGIFYAIMGAVVLSTVGAGAGQFGATGFSAGGLAAMGFLAIIVTPIIYGIVGFVGGAVGAVLYNLVAGWVGGIEIEFQERASKAK